MSQRKRPRESGSSSSKKGAGPSGSSGSGQAHVRGADEWESMERDEQDRRVKSMVRYLLCASSDRIPIKRKDVMDAVLKEKSRAFNLVFAEANKHLEEVFGLHAVECKKGTQQVYMIVNKLSSQSRDKVVAWREEEVSRFGLLYVILSLILMRPLTTASEEHIWNSLNRLGLQQDSHNHPEFGVVGNLLAKFVDQGYLEKEKKVAGEVVSFDYRWGPRAEQEVDRKELLAIMAELHGQEFEMWRRQFGDLIK